MRDARVSGWLSWLAAACALVALVLFGMIAGGLVVTRVMTMRGMGWDQIASTLGGLIAGGGAGLVAGLLAVWTLDTRGRLAAAAVALLGCVAAVAYLLATPPNVRRASAVEAPSRHVTSTRRLSDRPFSSLLVAIGRLSPRPAAVMRAAAMPRVTRPATTACARQSLEPLHVASSFPVQLRGL